MIALVGMSGRFPECSSIDALWTVIEQGRSCIRRFTPEELREAGVPQKVIEDPSYVPARGWFDDLHVFDAELFGYAEAEAAMIDPQQRLFLQEAWRTLENAGYRPDRAVGRVGVFAGCGVNTHLLLDMMGAGDGLADDDPMPKILGNEKDFLATRVSYKLGLKGPSLNIQTACSTSLAAVHVACQSLAAGECDMALAGGASVFVRRAGYFSQAGGILAPDGFCRPFDVEGRGFVPGNGVGVVCLKRLEDALADGDSVRLIIRGSAMVNDGNRKAGFTAPSMEGQVEAITEALAVAEAPSGSIGYVETHGTGTVIGDPIEFAALRLGLATFTDPRGCSLGALKANIGHLDTAAGVAGLIKVALMMDRGIIPPIANFSRPNPLLDLVGADLVLPRKASPWQTPSPDRWACVNSLGLGGTNVHVVVSGPPVVGSVAPPAARLRLAVVSGRSPQQLAETTAALVRDLSADTVPPLSDVAFTLGHGRFPHVWRRAIVATDTREMVARLAADNPTMRASGGAPKTGFLFPGGGAQHVGMARNVYACEPVYRQAFDRCAKILHDRHGLTIGPAETEPADISAPLLGLPRLFAVEWALAELWKSWGVVPSLLIGHSAGEYAAAAVAGVFSLENALELVVARSGLMAGLPPGGMLSVNLGEAEALRFLSDHVSLGAVNSRSMCVLSGQVGALQALMERLEFEKITYRGLNIDVAAHSHMIDAIRPTFEARVRDLRRCEPNIVIVSSATGRVLTAREATDPRYWGDHLRNTVRFAEAAHTLLDLKPDLLIEVGPGQSLTGLMREAGRRGDAPVRLVATLPSAEAAQSEDDYRNVLEALGEVWTCGAEIDWSAVASVGMRVALSTTAFEGQKLVPRISARTEMRTRGWAWGSVWVPKPLGLSRTLDLSYLIVGGGAIAAAVAEALRARGAVVHRAVGAAQTESDAWTVRPGNEADLAAMLEQVGPPASIVHLAGLDPSNQPDIALDCGAGSLLALHRALDRGGFPEPKSLTVVVRGGGRDLLQRAYLPFDAASVGFGFALAAETQAMTYLGVELADDLVVGSPTAAAAAIVDELTHTESTPRALVSRRRAARHIRRYAPVELADFGKADHAVVECLLITGGFGGLALAIARHFAEQGLRKLALVGSSLPEVGGAAHAECQALRALGVCLVTLKCDVSDAAQMARAVAEARRVLGRLDTVIHAAGSVAGGMAALKTLEELRRITRPKIEGAVALVEALRNEPPDRLMFFSALDSHLGTPGLTDHCAANSFLDAFAEQASMMLGVPVTSIAWEAWRETGQAAVTRLPSDIEGLRWAGRQTGLSNDEGCRILEACLASPLANLIICRDDLPLRIKEAGELAGRLLASEPTKIQLRSAASPLEPPQGDVEFLVCDLFRKVLGVDQIGVTDDFFALGGHSLLGLSLLNRLQRAFDIRVPLTVLITHPTPRALAEAVEDALIRESAEGIAHVV